MNKKIIIATTVAVAAGIYSIPAVKKIKNKIVDEVVVPLSTKKMLKKKASNKK